MFEQLQLLKQDPTAVSETATETSSETSTVKNALVLPEQDQNSRDATPSNTPKKKQKRNIHVTGIPYNRSE